MERAPRDDVGISLGFWRRARGAVFLLSTFSSSLAFGPACADSDGANATTGDDANWEAQSVREEGASTHLWIVNNALRILGQHRDLAKADGAERLMTQEPCRASWQQGLFDADYRHEYNHGRFDLHPGSSDFEVVVAGANWKSHFFDPDTRLNWKGESDPTAYTETLRHLEAARTFVRDDARLGCYELGLSLHYLTDITHPMHAALYTALSRPVHLHTHMEEYAMEIQDAFPLADWAGPPSGSLEAFVFDAAVTSKAAWPGTFNVVADAYEAHPNEFMCGSLRVSSINVFRAQRIDRPSCWRADPLVREHVGESLRVAQELTAKFLALVGALD